MSEHEMQHPDSPTWCVHCGTYDIYCRSRSCTEDRCRRFDTAVEGNAHRMFGEFFGIGASHERT